MHRIIPTCARRISLEESPTKLSKLNLGSYGHPDAYIVACTPLCTPTAVPVGRSTRRIGLMLHHIPGCILQCGRNIVDTKFSTTAVSIRLYTRTCTD